MKNLVEEARTCHGEHTTHGKFIQRLADRIEELEANLAKAIEALDWVKYGGGPKGESAHMKACETLDALKGEKDE
jgi:hypothetical protein